MDGRTFKEAYFCMRDNQATSRRREGAHTAAEGLLAVRCAVRFRHRPDEEFPAYEPRSTVLPGKRALQPYALAEDRSC